MESLSRPFHSRKLSNATTTTTTFSPKNAYHGVFSGHRHNYARAPGIDVQDYREIFATSSSSSIPVLDLSTLGESVGNDASSLITRSSKPDYSKIFGGYRDEDDAVSYEELFARDKARAPSSTRPTSQDSDDLSHQSSDALKQFNMSYHKISAKNKDGLDRTKHVTQLNPISGFTCFIDETSPPPKMEAEKHKSSEVDVSLDSSKEGFAEKQPSENGVRRKSKPHLGESFSEDKLLKTFEIGLNHSASSTNVASHKAYSKIPTAINSESCKTDSSESTYFHEELDVNSDAAASAAALRKAIEKAQESIRIAKESVGRKKKGLRSFSSKNVKESSKLDGRMEDVTPSEEQKYNDEIKVSDSSKAFPDLGRNRKYGGTVVFPNFNDGEKLFVAKKVIDEMNDKISESTKESSISIQSSNKFKDNTIISNSKQLTGETESRLLDSAAKDEHVSVSSEPLDTEKSDFVLGDQINNISLDDYEDEIKKTKPTAVKEPESVEKAYEIEEVGKQDAVRIPQKVEDEKKESQGSNENDDEMRLNEALGLLENEKQEDLEQEDFENIENEEMDRKKNNEASDKGIEEGSQWVESENGSKDDELKTESHKEEEIREMFYDVCELEMKDSSQTCVNSIEEVEMTLKDDCEMKQETGERKMDGLDEACDHEFDENSSGDDKFQIEDTEAIQGEDELEKVEFFEKTSSDQTISDDNEDECEVKNDNLADLGSADTAFGQNETEENDVRSESSSDTVRGVDLGSADTAFSQNETEENDVRSESSSDTVRGVDLGSADTAFGQNETEENDVPSESSSDTVRGVEEEPDESNKEKNTIDNEKESKNIPFPHKEMPKVESINEIKASEEPQVSNEKEKTMDVETGPRKEHRRKWHEIDEVTAREKEREKNRLAVDRAIREARERAFAESRERAERAAVEKATEEVRRRMMADAREKAAKASVGTKLSSERIAQSKLRAERAAVERATSEARQRALEKALSQKSVSEAGDLRSPNGTSTESAQRSKAKLEKHNRIMERVAKALAEKEKRDLLAQKEQAERNRLAENLDADIKRWSNGKEGNLRALLSTLQYILGPDSGWQAVSLTEIVSSSAVKKAYRKATLCVHPDKLQQRGASVQHKYICEKVFDLLKAAWNRFNSEER